VHANDTACTIFAFENRSYLGEFEAEIKKALARESGAQGVLFDEKTPRSKISRHCPFKGKDTGYRILLFCINFNLNFLRKFGKNGFTWIFSRSLAGDTCAVAADEAADLTASLALTTASGISEVGERAVLLLTS
jgi:hypothetical protein